jgi:hypothetical protein
MKTDWPGGRVMVGPGVWMDEVLFGMTGVSGMTEAQPEVRRNAAATVMRIRTEFCIAHTVFSGPV